MTQQQNSPDMTLCLQSERLRATVLKTQKTAWNSSVSIVKSMHCAARALPKDRCRAHLLMVEMATMADVAEQRQNHIQTLGCLQKLAASHSGLKAIVFSSQDDAESVVGALCQGASGYLVKEPVQDLQAQAELIARTMQELAAGHTPISSSVVHHLVAHVQRPEPVPAASVDRAVKSPLSRRETEVLRLAAKGFTYAEMAVLLELSVHTVSTHVRRIYSKFEVNSRGEAIYEASRQGLLREMALA